MSDHTFAQLLTKHLQRAGVSDSELARTIGVQRQTVFRWKEGLVARPRVREDVLQIAHKLRLTPVERDQLLLAAGFPPEDATLVLHLAPSAVELGNVGETIERKVAGDLLSNPLEVATAGASEQAPPPAETAKSAILRWRRPWLVIAWVMGVLLLGGGALAGWVWLPGLNPPPTPTALARQWPIAAQGETLLLVAQFTGYTSQQFNVAGRIGDELRREIDGANLPQTRVALWPNPVTTQSDAQTALAAARAALIIWGEYDSGRIRANLTLSDQLLTQSVDYDLTSADELVATINDRVPAEVRMLALLTVGTLYPLDEFYTKAAHAFQQALDLQPSNQKTRALLNFYMGLAVSRAGGLEALNNAIDHYSEALRLNPLLYDARYNQGTLRLNRSYLLDPASPEISATLEAAIADFTLTLQERPTHANAYLNRGIAYYEHYGADNPAHAIADFDRYIELQPDDHRGYYHRALAYIQKNDTARWVADLEQTLKISSTYGAAYTALCWGYALAQQPEQALVACDQAAMLDSAAASRDGRGIALAQLGRYDEASRELKAYLAWLRTLRPTTWYERLHGPEIVTWVKQLDAGQNPFDAATLAALR